MSAPIIAAVATVLLNTLWGVLLLVGLPGAWLMIVTAGVAEWLTPEFEMFDTSTLIIAVCLAALGEILELVASSQGAKRAGASRKGAIGALVGGLLGALLGTFMIPIPVVGSLMGGALGAFGGSALAEREGGKETRDALKVGRGAALGHLTGMAAKIATTAGVWLTLLLGCIVP